MTEEQFNKLRKGDVVTGILEGAPEIPLQILHIDEDARGTCSITVAVLVQRGAAEELDCAARGTR